MNIFSILILILSLINAAENSNLVNESVDYRLPTLIIYDIDPTSIISLRLGQLNLYNEGLQLIYNQLKLIYDYIEGAKMQNIDVGEHIHQFGKMFFEFFTKFNTTIRQVNQNEYSDIYLFKCSAKKAYLEIIKHFYIRINSTDYYVITSDTKLLILASKTSSFYENFKKIFRNWSSRVEEI